MDLIYIDHTDEIGRRNSHRGSLGGVRRFYPKAGLPRLWVTLEGYHRLGRGPDRLPLISMNRN